MYFFRHRFDLAQSAAWNWTPRWRRNGAGPPPAPLSFLDRAQDERLLSRCQLGAVIGAGE